MEELARRTPVASVEALLDRLAAGAQALAERAIEAASADRPGLPALPAEERLRGFVEVLPLGMAAIREDREPSDAEIDAIRRLARQRAREGLSLEATLHAYRSGATFVLGEAERVGGELGVPAEEMLRLTRRFWAWLDTVTVEVSSAFHAAEDGSRRAELLTALLAGSIGPGDLGAALAALGLDPGEDLHVVRARPAAGAPLHRLRRSLLAGGPGELTVDGDDLVGVLARRPEPVAGAVVAVAGPAAPAALAEPAQEAWSTLATALAVGAEGVVGAGDLGLLPAVVGEDRVGGGAVARCFGAFDGEARETMERTLAVLVEHDLHVDQAAAALAVHPNTLRYRLRRFTDTTGLDLGRVSDLVVVWWALQRIRLRPPPS